MRILATLKGERYELPHHAYGMLVEIDWPERRVGRALHFPAPSLRTDASFMAPLTGGMCALGNRLFVALWNMVVEVDYPAFRVVNAASSPWMADLHGMACDGHHLYVIATATECLLCLDPDSLAPLWRWGPGEAILAEGTPPGSWWQRWRSPHPWRPEQEAGDHRFTHKSRSPFYRHHLNDVRYHDGSLWLTTKGWRGDAHGSAVIGLDPHTRAARFVVPPGGGLRGVHDGVFHDGGLWVTESAANGVARILPTGAVGHVPLEPEGYFVRGLCHGGGTFWVGFTRLRQEKGRQAGVSRIMAYDEGWGAPTGEMALTGFYPEEVGAAVHALMISPGQEQTGF